MPSKLTLDALLVLDAIDRRGSFAAAATALHRVPSAITYTMQKLEQDLQVRLFKKEGRRHALTPAGKHLLNSGRELLLATEQLVTSTQEIDRGIEPVLRIALNTVYDINLLYPHIDQLIKNFPSLDVDVFEESLGGAWESIDSDRADLVIGDSERPKILNGIKSFSLPDLQWVFAVAPSHPLAQQKGNLSHEQIASYRAVVVQDTSRILAPLTRRVLDQQKILRVQTMRDKIAAQASGLGVGYLPQHRIVDLLKKKRLISLPLEEDITPTQMHLLWRQSNKGKALRWFVDYLQQPNVINKITAL